MHHVALGNRYAHRVQVRWNDPEAKQLLLARVLCGRTKHYGQAVDDSLVRPPLLPDHGDGLHDSVTGGPHMPAHAGGPAPGEADTSSVMTVVYALDQTYPEFLVTYR